MTHHITLGMIRSHDPCEPSWRTLIRALGTSDPDTTLTIGDVAASNGAAAAMWCLRCIEDPRVRVRAVLPAVKRASRHTTDQRVHDCIAMIDRWLDGRASYDELRAAARAAARAVTYAAACAAACAATCAATYAASYAARAAARAARDAAIAADAGVDALVDAADYAADAGGIAAACSAAVADAERAQQVRDLIDLFGQLHGETL
jgi:hypothetical protein